MNLVRVLRINSIYYAYGNTQKGHKKTWNQQLWLESIKKIKMDVWNCIIFGQINQVLYGNIQVSGSHLVIRRYCFVSKQYFSIAWLQLDITIRHITQNCFFHTINALANKSPDMIIVIASNLKRKEYKLVKLNLKHDFNNVKNNLKCDSWQ